MKVLDVQEVIDGIDQLVKAKKEDATGLETIEASIWKIHNLHSLEGEGGTASKDHFSQLHLPALRFFQSYIEQYIHQLETMKSYILNYETNNALVRQEFLQDTIPSGIDRVVENAIYLSNIYDDRNSSYLNEGYRFLGSFFWSLNAEVQILLIGLPVI